MSCSGLARPAVPVAPLTSATAIAMALLAGALLPVQAAMNAQVARSLQSVPLAALLSYLLGSFTLIGLLLSRLTPAPDWRAIRTAPRWSLLAGVLGVWYIVSSTLVLPRLGATLTLGLVVAGQAVAGLVMDHHGWLGVRRQRLGARGYAALALFLAAMALLTQTGGG
jgi:transporter family-2 protein